MDLFIWSGITNKTLDPLVFIHLTFVGNMCIPHTVMENKTQKNKTHRIYDGPDQAWLTQIVPLAILSTHFASENCTLDKQAFKIQHEYNMNKTLFLH